MSESTGYMGFVGVTTHSSSIMKLFPLWARELGLPTDRLIGHDVVPGSAPEIYRELVDRIRNDEQHYGALVTTHKMAVYAAAGEQFDDLDPLARTFEEVSSIAKRGDRLTGAAKDPITVQLALDEFLPEDHFARTGSDALILGSGGSGSALSHVLGTREDAPRRIINTARSQKSLDHLRELHERAGIPTDQVEYVLNGDADIDTLVSSLPAGSLVVNATGMGKDFPGSPLGDGATFPTDAIVWEFNYRGDLKFLHQARAQAKAQQLAVYDGWRYFIHGWTQVIADVFDIEMTREQVDRLAEIAETIRS